MNTHSDDLFITGRLCVYNYTLSSLFFLPASKNVADFVGGVISKDVSVLSVRVGLLDVGVAGVKVGLLDVGVLHVKVGFIGCRSSACQSRLYWMLEFCVSK